ncbi:4-hydroxy-2-oxoheptanedioate aldolase [Azospirillum endophyticum]|nr:4-hydroxy-2-oxoheptanedioate aldolase [Azospirillum endophyticum]
MMENGFKAALRAARPQIGLWLALAEPYCAEICATAGFDWLLIDGEHAPNDLRGILAQLQAIAPYRSHPVVRPPVGDPVLIKQLLDIGAQTLLVPMVDTAEQAAGLVAATRYPPNGRRGVGSGLARASRWGGISGYPGKADGEVCLLVQVESREGLDNLDAIAATPGVDGVFIGAADLAASFGHLGNPGHPEICRRVDDAIVRLTAAGCPAGALTGDPALARHYLGLGATFVAVGTDVSALAGRTRELASGFGVGGKR